MKQALFILAAALYLVSLCACGDQTIQSKSKQGSATRQVVQEQMANATGETTAPPTAIPEQQPASDETTPETSVPEPEQTQPAEALRYLGKRIKMNGQFAVYENPNTGAVYTACIIMDATACCSQGLEFVLAGEPSYPADYPEPGTEITVVGTFQTYEENGYMDYHLVDAEMTE